MASKFFFGLSLATNMTLLGVSTYGGFRIHNDYKFIKKKVPDLKYGDDLQGDDIFYSKSHPDSIFKVGSNDKKLHEYRLCKIFED